MTVLIKRYANRKLYNTETSRYITLKGIAELLEGGDEVRVIDNESGEDITSVALSQILVDSERTNTSVPRGLLSNLLQRGGDAIGAIRRGAGEAGEGIGEVRRNVRRLVRREGEAEEDAEGGRFSDWIAFPTPDVDQIVQNSVERVLKLLDLPRRSDIEALNERLERVAKAVERLEVARPPEEPEVSTPPVAAPPAAPTDEEEH